jgi:DNA-directed RNA polymerase sigma subunit (sigma70/sigma32)
MSDQTDPAIDQWRSVRGPYLAFLAVVSDIQSEIQSGDIESSAWPHATEVAARMGISPAAVEQIVRNWEHFVDTARTEFAATDNL